MGGRCSLIRWGGMIVLAFIMAGCASSGVKQSPAVEPEPEPDSGETLVIADEDIGYFLQLQSWEELRYFLDPVGPSPDGPDSNAIEWAEPLGPYEDGAPSQFPSDIDLDFEFEFEWTLTANLVLMGSMVRTWSGSPPGFGRLGANLNIGLEEGSWLSFGLYYGQGTDSFGGILSDQLEGAWEFGMDTHVRGNLAVARGGSRIHWLLGLKGGFYRWGSSGGQVNYWEPYGGFAVDLPLGKGLFLTGQATVGGRWLNEVGGSGYQSSPFEDSDGEICFDLGVVIPLSRSVTF